MQWQDRYSNERTAGAAEMAQAVHQMAPTPQAYCLKHGMQLKHLDMT